MKAPTDDNQVQPLLNAVLNSIKYNETSVFDGLLHSLRNGATSTEVADHLRHNLDALQSRGIIPDEDIDQSYLLNLASKVTNDNVDISLRPGLTTEDREYSFIFEDPKHGKEPISQRGEPRPSPQAPPYLQQSTLRTPNFNFERAGEPQTSTGANVDGYPSTTTYQASGPAPPHALAHTSSAYMHNQRASGVGRHSALQDLNLDYFPISSDGQLHGLSDLQTGQYTQSHIQDNAYAFHTMDEDPSMTSWPRPHTVPAVARREGTNVYADGSFDHMGPLTLPQQQRQQMQTHIPTPAILPQYHHHNIQQLHQQYPNPGPASRRPMQQPNTIRKGPSTSVPNNSVPQEELDSAE